MSAVISECGKYRYLLERDIRIVDGAREKIVCFMMLNPSVADAEKNDPTIRRCIDFAQREGGTRLLVVNYFAHRATNPRELPKSKDAEGPENWYYIEQAFKRSELVIVGWGSNKFARDNAARYDLLEQINNRLYGVFCLGTNGDGSPRHPLFLAKDTPLVPWKIGDWDP